MGRAGVVWGLWAGEQAGTARGWSVWTGGSGILCVATFPSKGWFWHLFVSFPGIWWEDIKLGLEREPRKSNSSKPAA